MNAKTAKLIRKAARAIAQHGTVTDIKGSCNQVKKTYNKKSKQDKAKFKNGLRVIPTLTEDSLNKPE